MIGGRVKESEPGSFLFYSKLLRISGNVNEHEKDEETYESKIIMRFNKLHFT